MDLMWIVGIVAALIVAVVVIGFALRGMRPKLPEPQAYTAPTTTPRTAASSAAGTASTLTPAVIAEIDRLVAAGQKINAIKVYRDHTGVHLKEAKDRIDHWSVSTVAPHTAATTHAAGASSAVPQTVSMVRSSLPPEVATDLDRLVAGGSPIVAIKLLRQHTGLGLKESKDLIDSWVPGHR